MEVKSQKTVRSGQKNVSKSWLNTSQILTAPRHIMDKQLKTKDKILKAARAQKDTIHIQNIGKSTTSHEKQWRPEDRGPP